jgi:hypothetical protein
MRMALERTRASVSSSGVSYMGLYSATEAASDGDPITDTQGECGAVKDSFRCGKNDCVLRDTVVHPNEPAPA